MTQPHYDLLVIGGGAVGSTAATPVAKGGRRVAVIERDTMGGTCLNYGCDPTKTLLDLGKQLTSAGTLNSTGIQLGSPAFDWSEVQAYLHTLIDTMRGGSDAEARAQLKQDGIDTMKGEARFVGPHEVAVGDTVYQADTILIATGSSAVVPDVPGLRDAGFLTNREAIWMDQLPGRMIIIGGGPIGIEFAQLFHRFGVKITVLEQGQHILSKDDAELTGQLRELLAADGIEIQTGIELLEVERTANERQVHFKTAQGAKKTCAADAILVASGFKPVIEGLHIQAAGVHVDRGAIVVDQNLRTNVAHIWAGGDVLGEYQFTHVASTQGRLLAQNMFADAPKPFDDRVIPWVTYTSPELAHVGKTEDELREAGTPYTVGKQQMKEMERAIVTRQTHGMVKLLVGDDGTILGGHILAAHAGEMIAPVALAMHAKLTARDLADTILPYPTFSEAVRQAARAAVEAQK